MLRHSLRLSLLASALFLLPACGGGGGGSAAASNEQPDQITPTEPLPEGFSYGTFECDGLSTGDDGQPKSVKFTFHFSRNAGNLKFGTLKLLKVEGFDNKDFDFEETVTGVWSVAYPLQGIGGNMHMQLEFAQFSPLNIASLVVDLEVNNSGMQGPNLVRSGTVTNLEFALTSDRDPSDTRDVKCARQIFNLVALPSAPGSSSEILP
ncbi:MAG: hypothetical protein MR894_04335 [Akkermansia muciniphila]|nr:hypothetical protein [Akkermansia muciniphila]